VSISVLSCGTGYASCQMGGLTFGAVCWRPGAVSYGRCLGEKAINGNRLRGRAWGRGFAGTVSPLTRATLPEQVNAW